jgi:hypothetical protein
MIKIIILKKPNEIRNPEMIIKIIISTFNNLKGSALITNDKPVKIELKIITIKEKGKNLLLFE